MIRGWNKIGLDNSTIVLRYNHFDHSRINMQDRQFVINSIKMDLFRVVTAVGNINNPIPVVSVNEFLTHAINDFNKIELTENDKNLKKLLESLKDRLPKIEDPHTRLRWAEDVLTTRCRI